MSNNQDIHLNYECDDVQGEDLLDQSANSEEEPIDQEVIVLEEVQPADPGHKLTYSDNDIFAEDDITDSQLKRDINVPIQEDSGVTSQSPEVEEALQTEPMEDGVSESEQDSAMDPSREGQDKGLEDPSLSPQSGECPPGLEYFRQEVQ